MCVSLISNSLETVEVSIVRCGKVAALDLKMHHVSILLTLTFIQGHRSFNHENNKCLIISETLQAMPIKFAVKIV